MSRLRKVARPESYVTAEAAANALREIAQEIVDRQRDGELISVTINRRYASREDVEYSFKKQSQPRDPRRPIIQENTIQ